jgi:hypothetical protein
MADEITEKTIKQIYNEASHYLHNPYNQNNTLIFFRLSRFNINLPSKPPKLAKGMRSVVQSRVLGGSGLDKSDFKGELLIHVSCKYS